MLAADIVADQKHPPGPPMTLGNMRELSVQHLIAYCLNDALTWGFNWRERPMMPRSCGLIEIAVNIM